MLSPRQIQVLRLLWNGSCRKEIAGRLGVSPKTVEYHLACAQKKAKTPKWNAVALCRWGLTHGYLTIPHKIIVDGKAVPA